MLVVSARGVTLTVTVLATPNCVEPATVAVTVIVGAGESPSETLLSSTLSVIAVGVASSSLTATVAEPFVEDTEYPVPVSTVTDTDPSASSTVSSLVETVKAAEPVVGIVTVCEPMGVAPKSLVWATVRFTVKSAVGGGVEVTVNVAAVPSVTGEVPGAMLISNWGAASTVNTGESP